MNLLNLRRLIQYLLLLYLVALTDFFQTLTRIWRRDQPRFLIEDRSVDFLGSVLSAVRQAKSPIKIPKMLYPQGVPLFADDEQNAQTSNDEMSDIEHLFSDSVGVKAPSWFTEPRDETTLPKILVAMKSNNKNEAEYALNEMVKIIEKIDMDAYSELVGKAFESFVKVARENANTDAKCIMILNHLPFLYSCSSSSDEFMHYGDQMLDYLIECLKKSDALRRTAIYATTALLERESISEDDLREKIIPTLFELLFSKKIIEEHRNELATALCRIAQSRLEPIWMFENFIPKYSHLLRDEHIHVKKAALSICGYLSQLFGEKFTEEFVVPHVIALIVDTNWSVRKTVCEIIVEVSHNCPPNIRKNLLAPNFIHLLRDTSRWVAYQAFQELGPFISTFADSRITGLNINEKGQVVKNGTTAVSKKHTFQFERLPDKTYVPSENKKPRQSSSSPEKVDEVLGEMNNMLALWDEFSSTKATAENPIRPSAAAKCSSVEDLTSLDFDDHEISFCEENEDDDDEIMEDTEDRNNTSNSNLITYWSASSNIVDISDDLIAFGTSIVTSSLTKLTLNNEAEEVASPASKSDTINTFTEKSSDTDSFKSEPDDLYDDPLRDCRGSDEEEEKMDVSDVESEEVSKFPQANHVPKDLVDNFLTMAAPSSHSDPDINRYCAHNFPAVAYTLGRDSWLLLKDTYKRLSNEDPRVRMTIASSLHEIGRIIGEEKTDNDLLPIFSQYKEDTPEIRYNILKNLYEFFQCLSEKKRVSMINVLPEIMPVSTNNLKNDWRYRHEFVKQCRKLCNLYGNEEINRTISAIALTMANDKIAEVRTEAVLLIVEIIRRLVNEENPSPILLSDKIEEKMPLTSNLLKDVITSFAKTQKWSRRLTFTHICRGLLEQKALSQNHFRYFLLAQLFGMTKVANVRLSACKVLALLDYDLSPQPFGGEITPTVKEILSKLTKDNDIDVAREARLTLKEDIEDKTDVALRGRKIHIKESAFFKDPNISCYDIKDMSIENEHEIPKENYDVVDMEIESESSTEELNTSEC